MGWGRDGFAEYWSHLVGSFRVVADSRGGRKYCQRRAERGRGAARATAQRRPKADEIPPEVVDVVVVVVVDVDFDGDGDGDVTSKT
jgi:hypothetical protein